MERLEYRHAVTNMFLPSCQSLLTTSHWNDPSEPIIIVSTSPGFGTRSSSTCLMNLRSLLAMVSGESFPSRRTRREGILRLISNMDSLFYREGMSRGAAWLGPSKKSLRDDTDQRLLFSCSKQMRRWCGRG